MDAKTIALEIFDHFWKPKWKKEALATYKGGEKFLNFKRDLLQPDRVAEITARLRDLKSVIKKRDQEGIKEATKQLIGTCEHSLKSYRQPDALAENIEVLFVAVAVALGIRAYYLQPFRIPTGSMQPTLNGIVGHYEPDPNWKKPNLLVQGFHKVTEGRTYVKAVAPESTAIVGISSRQFLWFFTKTDIFFENGKKLTINGSDNAIINGLGVGERLALPNDPTPDGIHYQFPTPGQMRMHNLPPFRVPVEKGQIIAQGYVDTGDLVLVDKFSYHFRKPKRGEVFVFETRGIDNIVNDARLSNQTRGSHYIKRLAGVPGDQLRLEQPALLINGKPAVEKGFRDVIDKVKARNGQYYKGYYNAGQGRYLVRTSDTFTLSKGPKEDQYFALGDNSASSSDSRYWGPIDEYLLVGPGFFTLWPLEHFGFIR